MNLKLKGKLVCQLRQVCRNCSFTVTSDSKHECFKKFCNYCYNNQPSGHFCYAAPQKPRKLTDSFLYVFRGTECTQDLQKHEGTFELIPKLIRDQQMCSQCEALDEMNVDCEQCGKRTHMFWKDPVGKFIDYLLTSTPFADKIYVITQFS